MLYSHKKNKMRFRRKTKILPGVYLNFSKSGVSTTIGPKGASVNLGKQGAFLNTGIPGTGLYNRQKLSSKSSTKSNATQKTSKEQYQDLIDEIKSDPAQNLTSDSLKELKATLLDCHIRRQELTSMIVRQKNRVKKTRQLLTWMRILLIGFVVLSFRRKWLEAKHELKGLQHQLDDEFIDMDHEWNDELSSAYNSVELAFEGLMTCHKVWDIIGAGNRQALKGLVVREECNLNRKRLAEIKSSQEALHFENNNGGELFFYPFFLSIVDGLGEFGIVDFKELKISYEEHEFTENNEIPLDSEVIDHRWFKENKDNSRDKRFKNNFQIPVCAYAGITFQTDKGVHEKYMFSNRDKASKFVEELHSYQKLLLPEL